MQSVPYEGNSGGLGMGESDGSGTAVDETTEVPKEDINLESL